MNDGLDCDLLVIGSGAGGLSAAVTAAHLGLSVIVIEKTRWFGGTTAWSGGWMWIPRNPLAIAAGIEEDIGEPRRYLEGILGESFDAARIDVFLAQAPAMVRFHLEHTALRFIDGNAIPDFHGRAQGARTGGRSVCAAPFDARCLAEDLSRLRPPAESMSFLGMSIGGDLRHFVRAHRAIDSFAYVARRVASHAAQRMRHGHGLVRMGGNALVAALMASARTQGVRLLSEHAACELLRGQGTDPDRNRIIGARVDTPTGPRTIRARRGVVLAAGGFPHDTQRKRAHFSHAPNGTEHHSAAPSTNTGDGIALGESVGAVFQPAGADAGAWAPVSLIPLRRAGATATVNRQGDAFPARFAHLVERGKPGLIAAT